MAVKKKKSEEARNREKKRKGKQSGNIIWMKNDVLPVARSQERIKKNMESLYYLSSLRMHKEEDEDLLEVED
jgi:hypothetical protein